MVVQLSRLVLLVRNGMVQATANFYHQAIGLPIIRVTDEWAELSSSSNNNNSNNNNHHITLCIQAVTIGQESQLSIGYTPWITFTVTQFDTTITSCIQAGAHLDGPIQYPAHGKIALLRTPYDSHMIGLYEPITTIMKSTTSTSTSSSTTTK